MNLDNLKNLPREELMALAGKLGLSPHWKCKDETVIKMISEKAHEKPKDTTELVHKAEAPAKPVHNNTAEEVEAMLEPIKARRPEFVSEYNADENTWKFSCLGAAETGNLAIPMRVIKMKAENIARGRIQLMGHRDFDHVTTSDKNRYTNTVLMA